jgi:hypothetical protein
MDDSDIVAYLFIYDDSTASGTPAMVGDDERCFIEALVKRFQHHRNLIWCIAEEYQERYSPNRSVTSRRHPRGG